MNEWVWAAMATAVSGVLAVGCVGLRWMANVSSCLVIAAKSSESSCGWWSPWANAPVWLPCRIRHGDHASCRAFRATEHKLATTAGGGREHPPLPDQSEAHGPSPVPETGVVRLNLSVEVARKSGIGGRLNHRACTEASTAPMPLYRCDRPNGQRQMGRGSGSSPPRQWCPRFVAQQFLEMPRARSSPEPGGKSGGVGAASSDTRFDSRRPAAGFKRVRGSSGNHGECLDTPRPPARRQEHRIGHP